MSNGLKKLAISITEILENRKMHVLYMLLQRSFVLDKHRHFSTYVP